MNKKLTVILLLQGIFHNFNIFRMREKQIPVDIVEVKGEYNIKTRILY